MRNFVISLMAAVVLTQESLGFNILGIFPSTSKSHYIVGGALMKGLAASGHNVTVISPFPQKKSIPNFRDYAVVGIVEEVAKLNMNVIDMHYASLISSVPDGHTFGLFMTNFTLSHPRMTEFLSDPNEHFDVVICEIFINEAMLGLGQHFNAPVIGLSTFGSSMWSNDLVGTPSPLSYVPHPFLSFNNQMTFVQRVGNTLLTIYQRILYDQYLLQQQGIYEKMFPGKNKPTLKEIRKNVSLVLLNQHFTTNYPQPYVPNMIEIGGIQINRAKPNALPDDIRIFMEGATHGVVYFSMGTNIQISQLPDSIRDGLLRSFGKLKQRVLWKWEIPDLPGKPDNVMIRSWLPQDDILAHPNVKAFITHGGLLSMTEAVYHGLPIIGIPMFADQYLNMASAQSSGYGLTVAFSNLTEQSMNWALQEILNTNKYSISSKTISSRHRDQPLPPLELAKFWVEYVVRHNGAPHMHSSGQDLHFIAYHSIDVFAFLATVVGVFLYLAYWLIKLVLAFAFGSISIKIRKSVSKKQQ